jgi:Zn-dependent alcohol dehydrogenase
MYYAKRLLPLEKLISKKYALKDINQAIDDLKNKKIARGLIQCVI